jgi:hypothetical protein
MARSSSSTATDRAQKGDSKPGHRQVPRRLDDQDSRALTDALGNLVRFELPPGQRCDTVRIAPLIEDIAFGGLIADKAFDVDWIFAELDERGAQVVIPQHPRRTRSPCGPAKPAPASQP